jgi:hypothetical protein
MKTEQAIQVLRDYNLWRRGDDAMEQPDPHTVGEAIDSVLVSIQKAEAERDLWRETAEESFQTRAWKQLIEEEKSRMRKRLEYMVGDDWGDKLSKSK